MVEFCIPIFKPSDMHGNGVIRIIKQSLHLNEILLINTMFSLMYVRTDRRCIEL